MPFKDAPDAQTAIGLMIAAFIGALTWLAKVWSENGSRAHARKLVGGMLGSAVAAFTVGAMLVASRNVSVWLVLAIAGPTGWGGGELLGWLLHRWTNGGPRGGER